MLLADSLRSERELFVVGLELSILGNSFSLINVDAAVNLNAYLSSLLRNLDHSWVKLMASEVCTETVVFLMANRASQQESFLSLFMAPCTILFFLLLKVHAKILELYKLTVGFLIQVAYSP